MTKTPLRAILARATTDRVANKTLRPKSVQADHTRRALFGFVGLAGVAVAMPAIVVGAVRQTPTAFAELHAKAKAAEARFNSLQHDLEYTDPQRFEREEAAFHEAGDAFAYATPTNLSELAIALENTIGGGSTGTRDQRDRLVKHARDLAAKEGR
jgi:hypothetical protein